MVSRKSKTKAESENSKKSETLKKTKRKKKTVKRKTKEYTIPKDKFNDTLNVINENIDWDKDPTERRCSVLIHNISPNIRQSYKNITIKLFEEARLCVLQRDWKNLARILTMAKPYNRREHNLFFQVFVRYGAICLAHNPDEGLSEMFMQGVASCSGESEKQQFIKSLTSD